MPVVPFTPSTPSESSSAPTAQPPSEEFQLMAAALMHQQGRLIATEETTDANATE